MTTTAPSAATAKKVLLTREELDTITDRLAREIEDTYRDSDKRLVLVIILKGSMPFAADLMRKIRLPLQIEFMKVSSYGAGTKTSGEIRVSLDLNREDLPDTDLLIVEDIVDSGRTLSRLSELLRHRNAHSVRAVTLLDKPSRREVPLPAGFLRCRGSGRVRGGLRAGLQRDLPQPAVCRRAPARGVFRHRVNRRTPLPEKLSQALSRNFIEYSYSCGILHTVPPCTHGSRHTACRRTALSPHPRCPLSPARPQKDRRSLMKNNLKVIIGYVLAIVVIVGVIAMIYRSTSSKTEVITYDKVVAYFQKEEVREFEIDNKNNLTMLLYQYELDENGQPVTDENGNRVFKKRADGSPDTIRKTYKLARVDYFHEDLGELIKEQIASGVLVGAEYEPAESIPFWLSYLPGILLVVVRFSCTGAP